MRLPFCLIENGITIHAMFSAGYMPPHFVHTKQFVVPQREVLCDWLAPISCRRRVRLHSSGAAIKQGIFATLHNPHEMEACHV